MVFLLLVQISLTFFIVVDGISGQGGIKMESANTQSVNEPAKTSVQLKPTIKQQISGRMVSIGISEVVTASEYSEKTRLKKCMMMMMIIIIITSNRKTIY